MHLGYRPRPCGIGQFHESTKTPWAPGLLLSSWDMECIDPGGSGNLRKRTRLRRMKSAIIRVQ